MSFLKVKKTKIKFLNYKSTIVTTHVPLPLVSALQFRLPSPPVELGDNLHIQLLSLTFPHIPPTDSLDPGSQEWNLPLGNKIR